MAKAPLSPTVQPDAPVTCLCAAAASGPRDIVPACCDRRLEGAYLRADSHVDLLSPLRLLASDSKDLVRWEACPLDYDMPGVLLQESFRVLKPGGRLELSLLPTGSGRAVRVEWLYHWLADLDSFGLHQWPDGRVTLWAVNTPAAPLRRGACR